MREKNNTITLSWTGLATSVFLSFSSHCWCSEQCEIVLTFHQPQRSLRSVNQNLLSVPRCNSSFGQRSFSYRAPKIWNDIPLSVRQSPSLDSFKCNLKTHYFANNWPPGDCLQCLRFEILDTVRFTNCYEWMNDWLTDWLTDWLIDCW